MVPSSASRQMRQYAYWDSSGLARFPPMYTPPLKDSTFGSSATAVVTKMRLPQTMGEEWPAPGIGVFHLTFSCSFHFRGRFVSVEIPRPSPRQPGQLAVEVDTTGTIVTQPMTRQVRALIMIATLSFKVSVTCARGDLQFRVRMQIQAGAPSAVWAIPEDSQFLFQYWASSHHGS